MTKQKKRNTFLLKDVNPLEVDKKYGIQPAADIPTSSTKITELISFPSSDHKQYTTNKNVVISMYDMISRKKLEGNTCFWCRLSFEHSPLGCPINYIPARVVKECTSDTTKEKYVLKENIPSYEGEGSYYLTDGIYCSFNCCLSFIHSVKHDPYYSHSKEYLYHMHMKSFPTSPTIIHPAPSWRLLQTYGGNLSPDEFRSSFNNYIYIDKKTTLETIPYMRPVGHIYERKYVF